MFPCLDSPSATDIPEESSSRHLEKHFFSKDFEASSLYPVFCPECCERKLKSGLRFFFVNEEETVFKCSTSDCLYPFREFIFKNFTDNTIYRYKSLEGDPVSLPHSPAQNFTTPEISFPFQDFNLRSPESSQNSVDFNFDIVLDEESVSSCKEELSDIKEWLDGANEEKTNPEDDQKAPRKLQKSIQFPKEEFIKLEPLNKACKIEPSITPLDYLKVIKSDWTPGKISWASKQNVQSTKKPEAKESSIRAERRLQAPKIEKKDSLRGRKVKIEQKSEPEEEKIPDPDQNCRRSARIRNRKEKNDIKSSESQKKSNKKTKK